MQNSQSQYPGHLIAVFYIAFTVLAFSSIEIIVNPVRNDIAPFLMNFWRFFVAVLILLPTLLWKHRARLRELRREDLRDLTFLGCLNILLAMGAHAICIKYSRASTAAILISANPLATNFFAWLILREEMTLKRIFALLLGFSGVILISLKTDGAVDTPLGVGTGIVALAGFGLYTVLSKRLVHKHGGLTVMVISCIPALVIYLPLLYLLGIDIMPPSHTWPNILGAGILGTGLGYISFMKVLGFLPAGRCSYLFFFKPPVAIFFAWLLLGEEISGTAMIGTLLIMAGIFTEIKRAGQKTQSA